MQKVNAYQFELNPVLTIPKDAKWDTTIVDFQTVTKIFNEMAARKDIPFVFPYRGCEARAHRMSLLLKEQNIQVGKIFTTGFLKVTTPSVAPGFVVWQFHVAVTLKVRSVDSLTTQTYVIDPSLFDRPVTVEAWVLRQMQHEGNRLDSLIQTPPYVYDLKFTNSLGDIGYNLADLKMMKKDLALHLRVQRELQKNSKQSYF